MRVTIAVDEMLADGYLPAVRLAGATPVPLPLAVEAASAIPCQALELGSRTAGTLRKGAVAALIIHTTPTAGYGWEVVRNSWGHENPQVKLETGQAALAFALTGTSDGSAESHLPALTADMIEVTVGEQDSFHPIHRSQVLELVQQTEHVAGIDEEAAFVQDIDIAAHARFF